MQKQVPDYFKYNKMHLRKMLLEVRNPKYRVENIPCITEIGKCDEIMYKFASTTKELGFLLVV